MTPIGIGIGVGLPFGGGGGAPPVFLLRDEFTTDRAAGAVNGTAAEPGPGPRTAVDTGNNLRINGGRWDQIGGTANYGDPGTWYDAFARVAGRTMFVYQFGTNAAHHFGWDSNQIGVARSGFSITANIDFLDQTGIQVQDPWASGYAYAVVLRASGSFHLVNAGAGWTLRYVGTQSVDNPVYPTLAGRNTAGLQFDDLRIFDMAAPWDTTNGIATQVLSGARNPGDTFIHEADGFVQFTVQTLPAADQIEVRFRVQDATNYWQVTVDAAGTLDLDEVVAGVVTNRATAAGVANGNTILVRFVDERITGCNTTTRLLRWNYALAANFKTRTDGELETEGTGGAVTDIISWPRVLSGAALAEIERYTA